MIPVERPHLHVSAITHPGMSGKNNEDRYSVSAYRIEGKQQIPTLLAIVADGIGGHQAGEVAAEIAVERTSQAIAASDGSTPALTLRYAIQNASQAILAQSERDHQMGGMGATCSCVWIINDRLFIAYVGDSRIYLITENTIHQLSKDHTWVQDALDAGIIEPAEAQSHPNAHMIRRYLGSKKPAEPDTRLFLLKGESDEKAEANQGIRLLPGDQIILCSDGLTDLVSDEEIQDTLSAENIELGLERLVNLANQRGGHDNITIVALKMPDNDSLTSIADTIQVSTSKKKKTKRQRRGFYLVLFILALITLFSLVGFFYLTNKGSNQDITPSKSLPIFTETIIPTQTINTPYPTNTHEATHLPQSASPLTSSPIKPASTEIPFTLTAWPTNTKFP